MKNNVELIFLQKLSLHNETWNDKRRYHSNFNSQKYINFNIGINVWLYVDTI